MKPLLSVVIPCRNEGQTIGRVLDDLARQTYAAPFEVVVADGGSTDGTREVIAEAGRRGPPFALRVVENPARHIPGGLNAAVGAARGRLIVRIDGHCRLEPGHLATIAASLEVPGQDVVGPRIVQVPGGGGAVAEAICRLLTSPLGTGGTPSRSRLAAPRLVAHTVMSCYRREVWERIGGYDERLLSNEDFDFDYRAGRAGFRVVSLPAPEFRLLARPTIAGLVRQRWRYGWWKSAVIRKFPASLHLRQAVPPLALLGFLALAAAWPLAAGAAAGAYVLAAQLAGAVAARGATAGRVAATVALAPLVLAAIHGPWALALLVGFIGNRVPVRQGTLA